MGDRAHAPWPAHPTRNPVVVAREEWDDEALLFHPDTGETVGVNQVGLVVWRLLDGSRGLAAIMAGLRQVLADVPPSAREDVVAFVAGLAERGLARFGGTAPPVAAPPVALGSRRATLMRTPRQVSIDITARCNLRCRYCYFFDNPAVEYRDLPTAEWLRFFDELGRCGVMRVCLAGGEPFMRPDLPELVAGLVRNGLRFAILSNGALVTDALAAQLAATGRCDYVQISVDGSSAEIHDSARGTGAFAGAIRGLRTLQRHGIEVTARTTVLPRNLADLDAVARLLLDELGVGVMSTNAAGHLGSCQQHRRELQLAVAQRGIAMAALERLAARYPGRITGTAGPLAEARAWRAMEAARCGGAPPFAGGGRLSACGCPRQEIAVRSDGVIVPCPLLAHLELGRVTTDSLASVWRDGELLNRLRARGSITLDRFPACAGCPYVPYCTGNCPGTAFTLTGGIDVPSPDACLRRFLAQGGRLP